MTKLSEFGIDVGTFYERLKHDETYKKQIQKTEQEFIRTLEMHMAHEFRYYQKEAISIFDFFLKVDKQHYAFKEEIYEREFGDGTVPFYGFEMATGSGKTLLIGALMLYLYQKGHSNFLVITPGEEIYSKTINNFDMMNSKCVFSSYLDIEYNVITGDNFTDKSSNYLEDAAFNIFIFNIQKFFDRETGVLRVDKEWEESFWRDHLGNTISFRDYLKSQKLVIITDEAHHYQNFRVGRGRKSSGDIILSLMPEMVLEFTATAVTEDAYRRAQKIIYNYPIDSFIDDGYGKKVRAYGYTGSPIRASTAEVTEDDKKKFLVAFLIHMLKKKALEKEKLKPILLVRGRDIEHSNNFVYTLQEELPYEEDLIEATYNEVLSGEKFEVTELIRAYVPLDEFKKGIASLPEKSFVYHSDNENDEEVRRKVDTIETNDQEVLVQIKKLEEGWDIQNPYTILILSIAYDATKVYVKQLIGRGVRLFREKRRYDDLTNFLDKQQEILHVVCEKGSNFERFVSEIRDELGLSHASFEAEPVEEERKNPSISEFQKHNNLELPIIDMSSACPLTPSELLEKLSYESLSLDQWVNNNVKSEKGQVFWIWDEEEVGIEKDVTDDIDLRRGEAEFDVEDFKFESAEIDRLVTRIVAGQTLLPSHVSVRSRLRDAITRINDKTISYKRRSEMSRDFYREKASGSILDFVRKVINNYFEVTTKFKKATLNTLFPDLSVVIKKNAETGRLVNLKRARDVSIDRDGFRNLCVTDFSRAYYEYNRFDSSHEFKLAFQLDGFDDVEFWIRNERTYYLEYGVGNRYHPDFVVKYGDDLFIIEVKGTGYLETHRAMKGIEILSELRSRGHKVLFLLDTTIDNKIFRIAQNFRDVINNDDLEEVSKV
jgi:type III restriction enzyme